MELCHPQYRAPSVMEVMAWQRRNHTVSSDLRSVLKDDLIRLSKNRDTETDILKPTKPRYYCAQQTGSVLNW